MCWLRVVDRVEKGSSCPVCAGSKPCLCNSLAALHPHVLDSWDWEANGSLTPNHLLPSSCRKVLLDLCPHQVLA